MIGTGFIEQTDAWRTVFALTRIIRQITRQGYADQDAVLIGAVALDKIDPSGERVAALYACGRVVPQTPAPAAAEKSISSSVGNAPETPTSE